MTEHDNNSLWIQGIDVSNHQGVIDWNFVGQSGVQFAFIKATEGGTYQDKFYQQNIRGAKAAAVLAGPYHFFRPKGPVNLQIENFLKVCGTAETPDLPPVLDLEVPNDWGHFKVPARVEMICEFLNSTSKALGRKPIIYMSSSFSEDVLSEAPELSEYPLWLAHHTPAPKPWIPRPWTSWNFWQYTDKGTINGINGPVDLDRFNGTHSQLLSL
ncbi:MAG: glycosyl hydrolase family 25 [Cyanobacteria bacterium SZAS-4]|nr:glycosyl hydrolase family 25 [Cyanobacteria bacterium SZAS-4]